MASKEDIKAKLWMKKSQASAKAIMTATSDIWQERGWESGADVDMGVLKRKLALKFGGRKLNPVVAEILEDANYHEGLQALQELGLVKYKGNLLTKYRKLGGKTWEL